MGFTLGDAVSALRQSSFWSERAVSGEPLAGDPRGVVFHVLQPPIRPGSLTLRFTSGSPVPAWFYTYDPESGAVYTADVPPLPMVADYVSQQLSDAQLEACCVEALLEVESRLHRGYRWSGAGSSASLVDGSGQEPVVPEGRWSEVPVERALFMAAAEYCLVKNLLKHAASSFFYYRTGAGGVVVDRRDQPRNLREALVVLERRLEEMAARRAAALGPGTLASWEEDERNVGAWWNRPQGIR